MRWEGERESENVEDRRGISFRGGAIGGGAVVVALVAALLGAPPSLVRALLGGGSSAEPVPDTTAPPAQESAQEARTRKFVSVVLASTEDVWGAVFQQRGQPYQAPRLVLFRDQVSSHCGQASSVMGPFYCPLDRRVFLDMGFFEELERRFGAPGEFARAYVIAHEVGHHVQTLLGTSEKVHQMRSRGSEEAANHASVQLELQADCYAGVWAFHANQTRHILEPGDAEKALAAASAIGDDTLQKQTRGYVVPESFTHGSSAQRVRWFRQGLTSGRLEDCDTFGASSL